MVGEDAGRGGAELERIASGDLIEQVANKVDRPAEDGLGAVAVMGRVYATVLEDADVVCAPVGLDEIVVRKVNVVVVNIDRGGSAFWIGIRWAIGRDADRIVEVSDGIVSDYVSGAVNLDGKEAA